MGLWLEPIEGVRWSSSGETPGAGVKQKCWRRVTKKMKSSTLARVSPGHALLPVREEVLTSCPSRWNDEKVAQGNLLKMARKHLAWQTSHPPESVKDKRCEGVPIQSHQAVPRPWKQKRCPPYNLYATHTVASAQCQFKPHDVTLLGCQRHLKL